MVQRRGSKKPPDQGGWNMFCGSLGGSDILIPATHYALRGNGGQAWPSWPTSPGIEELLGRWFDAPGLATQKQLADEMQAQAFEDVPYYPLGIYYRPTAYRANLDGVLDDIPAFWNVRRT